MKKAEIISADLATLVRLMPDLGDCSLRHVREANISRWYLIHEVPYDGITGRKAVYCAGSGKEPEDALRKALTDR